MNEAFLALLSGAELFGALPPNECAACAATFRESRLGKNEMLFARGDPGDHMYVLAEGQVRLAIATGDGRELSFQIVERGELFGEIALLDGGRRGAEAVALEASVVWRIERAEFGRLRATLAGLNDATIAFLCSRIRRSSYQLETIALYALDVRLARFLVAALRGMPETPGKRTPLEFHYSQGELAQLLGASRPKINAALASLETAGAVRRTSDRLFCDRAKLMEIAQLEAA